VVCTNMEKEQEKVSDLLALAEAMSAAQEKATGNSKLDMAGIMAAMAVATEKSRGAGGISRSEGGKGVAEERSSGDGREGVRNKRGEESTSGHQWNVYSGRKTLLGEEKIFEADEINTIHERVIPDLKSRRISGDSTAKKNTFGILMRESSSLSLFSTPKPYKKFEESDDSTKYFGVQNTDDNKLDVISAVSAINIDKDELANISSFDEFSKERSKDMSDYLDQSDEGIIKLKETISRMSATKKEVTGNEKLNLSDLVVGIASIIQDDGMDSKVNDGKLSNRGNEKPGRKASALTVNMSGTRGTSDTMSLVRKEAVKGSAVAKGGIEEKHNEKEKLINKSEELSDPVVRKLVYGQYRQMLRNHKN